VTRGRTQKLLVEHVAIEGGRARVSRRPDELIVEEPMEIRLDGHLVTTTMRTPGDDFELAVGLCFTDGLLAGAPVTGCRYCGECGSAVDTEFNVVTVETAGRAPVPVARVATTTSSCGLCGSASLDALRQRLEPLRYLAPIALEVLARAPSSARALQPLFDATGGVHAAAAFTAGGEVLVVREDIGRHNAVDKVVGRLLLDDRLPAHDLGLYVSGRASFEIVQKAWAAGFAAIVAVSAPSQLAVETARAAGLTLVGFARDGHMNLYSKVGE
jgi:FdhD protein